MKVLKPEAVEITTSSQRVTFLSKTVAVAKIAEKFLDKFVAKYEFDLKRSIF